MKKCSQKVLTIFKIEDTMITNIFSNYKTDRRKQYDYNFTYKKYRDNRRFKH